MGRTATETQNPILVQLGRLARKLSAIMEFCSAHLKNTRCDSEKAAR